MCKLNFLLNYLIFIFNVREKYYAVQRIIGCGFRFFKRAIPLRREHQWRLQLWPCLVIEIGYGKVVNRSRRVLSRAYRLDAVSLRRWSHLLIHDVTQMYPVIYSPDFSEFLWCYLVTAKNNHISRRRWIQAFESVSTWLSFIRCFPIEVFFLSRRLLWRDDQLATLCLLLFPFRLSRSLWDGCFTVIHGVTMVVLGFWLRYLR